LFVPEDGHDCQQIAHGAKGKDQQIGTEDHVAKLKKHGKLRSGKLFFLIFNS
jgi:hypothetical protein